MHRVGHADLRARALLQLDVDEVGDDGEPRQQPGDGRVRVREAVERELRRGGIAVDDGTGAFAEIVASQTSSGSTSESSRKTRSHATRRDSAALSAVTRACLSAASADWLLTLAASGVGMALSSSCSDESVACLSFALPLAERNVADITAVSSTASTTGTSTSHCGF